MSSEGSDQATQRRSDEGGNGVVAAPLGELSAGASSSDRGVAVSVQGLSKCYEIYERPHRRLLQTLFRGRRQFYREFWALRDVSFELRRGETLAIVGRNGSGKSTLLQLIAGTLRPTAGSVTVHGRVHALLELGSGFNPEFTGRENVFLNGAVLGLSSKQIQSRLGEIERFADIGEFIDQPVKTYSTGMVVRLAFAVQVQLWPDVLIVDEALAVGDEKFQRKCYARLEELRAGGVAVLLVTHAMSTVEKYCERALLLHNGVMHGLGPAKQIVDQYHALLYADEEAYLRYVRQASQETPAPIASPEGGLGAETVASDRLDRVDSPPRIERALTTGAAHIQDVWLHGSDGTPRELFRPGDTAELGLRIVVEQDVGLLQAGIRLRTVEGVEVFGTSSGYFERCLEDVRAGSTCVARFQFQTDLCEGVYFVTVAIADAQSEMRYLDKRTDVLILRVRETPLRATGIAHLSPQVSMSKEESVPRASE